MSRYVTIVAFLVLACASAPPEPRTASVADMGGWMVDAESVDMKFGVHRYREESGERFVLQELGKRNQKGQVVEWHELSTLNVRVSEGEFVLQGFECGTPGRRGDAIAVARGTSDNLTVVRAWRIDLTTRQFVPADPLAVTCEVADEEE